jgi:diadenosine tetraphosphatase ApaH/serine/threonine PP2A family protein phosphatase
VTGDLSANGQADELAVVAAELARFGSVPTVVLPGNRDLEASAGAPGEAVRIPVESDLDYFLALEPALSFEFGDEAARRTKPAESTWADSFGTLEPTLRAAGLQVVTLNSTPRLATESLERAARRLRATPAGSLRVVALHHGLLPIPGRKLREGDVTNRAGDVLALLCDLHVDLVLHGHIHRAHVWQISDGRNAVVVASAGALVNDGRRDASFLEVIADEATLRINRRSVATGALTTLYQGTRQSSLGR